MADRREDGRPPPGAPAGGDGPPGPASELAGELAAQEKALVAGAPASRVAVVARPAISFGVGSPAAGPWSDRARRAGLATVPRTTGGGPILHLGGDLVWSLVVPREDPRAGRDFVRAYARLGAGVIRGLAAVGVAASWTDAPGLTEEYCPLSSRGSVLTAAGRILGGAAQHVTGRALLHHGTVSVEVDRTLLDRIFELPGGASARLGSLRELGVPGAPAELARSLRAGLTDPAA